MNNSEYIQKFWKKNIALFLSGQAVTLLGSSLVGFAVIWYVTLRTQSGMTMTLFTIATMVPTFFISPFGGVWADRYNKKYLINIADASIAIVTLGIAIAFSIGLESLILLFICCVIRSFGQGVQMPAVTSLIPQITPEEHLMRTNGINGSIQSLSQLAAPALAGVLLSVSPIQTILFIDVFTAIIGISILFFLVRVPIKSNEERALINSKSNFTDIKDAIAYLKDHSFVKRLFVISAIFMFLLTPAALLSPLQVTRDFGADVWRLTIIELAFSFGMLAGGILISSWGGFKNKTVTMICGLILFSIMTIGLGLATNFTLYSVFMGLSGFSVPIINTPILTVMQAKVDESFLGRIMSVFTMISSIALPIGMLLFGPLGDAVAIDYLMIGTGTGMLIIAIVVFFDKTLLSAGILENKIDLQ